MTRISLSNLLKYLIGLLVFQGATVILVLVALRTSLGETWVLFALLGLVMGVPTALWFTSIADHAGKHALANAKEQFSKERERIRLRAEQDKAKKIEDTHRRLLRERNRVQNSSTLKLGAALAGVAGLGVALFLTQFMTLGMLMLTTAGGALVGYGVRARQDWLGRQRAAIASNEAGQPERVTSVQAELLPRQAAGQRGGPH
jgi:hypothetical protein